MAHIFFSEAVDGNCHGKTTLLIGNRETGEVRKANYFGDMDAFGLPCSMDCKGNLTIPPDQTSYQYIGTTEDWSIIRNRPRADRNHHAGRAATVLDAK